MKKRGLYYYRPLHLKTNVMDVLCINDHFKDAKGNIPANQPKVGDIDQVISIVSCPLGHVMYELKRFPNLGWDANQFSPLSEIDEADFTITYNEEKA